jgi:hypothetical protein
MTTPKIYTVANPAAGANFSFTVPTDFPKYQLIGLYYKFVADVNVANRVPLLLITDGTIALYKLTTSGTWTANSTSEFSMGIGFSQTGSGLVQNYIPNNNILLPNFAINSAISGIQIGDQISLLHISFLV